MDGYVHVPSIWDLDEILMEIRKLGSHVKIDAVECLWELGVVLAARLREALDLPGMREEQAICFRDKERT